MLGTFDSSQVRQSAEVLRDDRVQVARTTGTGTAGGRGWGSVTDEMARLLSVEPAGIADVIGQQRRVQVLLDRLPPTPGTNRVATFNDLYRTITERIAGLLRDGRFEDSVFLEHLDVEFARRYFDALLLWGDGTADTPDSWEVLFRRAEDRRVTSLAAAALGVNAHINQDLAMALVATWRRHGRPVDSRQHHDYLLVNEVFFEAIPELRRRYSTAWQLAVDRLNGRLDDWSQNLLVEVTRGMAWDQAERLWALRDEPAAMALAHTTMDRATAWAGEALLLGDSLSQRMWRLFRRMRRRLCGSRDA